MDSHCDLFQTCRKLDIGGSVYLQAVAKRVKGKPKERDSACHTKQLLFYDFCKFWKFMDKTCRIFECIK